MKNLEKQIERRGKRRIKLAQSWKDRDTGMNEQGRVRKGKDTRVKLGGEERKKKKRKVDDNERKAEAW